MKMSRSFNAKVNSLNETPNKRKERYDNKNVNRVKGRSGTSRIRNLKTTSAIHDVNNCNEVYENTKCNNVEKKSILSKIISRFR